MSTWHKFTGRYIKKIYQVRMPDGYAILAWPNAGKMFAMDGSGKQYTVEDNIEVRIAPYQGF